jgi:hypothetical protein
MGCVWSYFNRTIGCLALPRTSAMNGMRLVLFQQNNRMFGPAPHFEMNGMRLVLFQQNNRMFGPAMGPL